MEKTTEGGNPRRLAGVSEILFNLTVCTFSDKAILVKEKIFDKIEARSLAATFKMLRHISFPQMLNDKIKAC